jgi:ribonucleotide monophosphatase NagD (HAD superfamily)
MVRSEVYSPERVSAFQNIFDSAWEDLVTSGSPLAQYVNAEATRNALARHILALGNTGMSPEEIKRTVLKDVAVVS